jgi:hypothetical protein
VFRITIQLQSDEYDALIILALSERREPRNQAALIIRHELEKAGLLTPETAQPAQVTDRGVMEREPIHSPSNSLSEAA